MVPGLLGLLGGGTSALAIAPALRALSWPFLILTVAMLGRGWYLTLSHGGGWRSAWSVRARITLIASTALAVLMWAARFAGVMGPGMP